MRDCKRCGDTQPMEEYAIRDRVTGRRDTTCKRCRCDQQREARERFKWPPDEVAPIWNAWRYPATAGQLTWRV